MCGVQTPIRDGPLFVTGWRGRGPGGNRPRGKHVRKPIRPKALTIKINIRARPRNVGAPRASAVPQTRSTCRTHYKMEMSSLATWNGLAAPLLMKGAGSAAAGAAASSRDRLPVPRSLLPLLPLPGRLPRSFPVLPVLPPRRLSSVDCGRLSCRCRSPRSLCRRRHAAWMRAAAFALRSVLPLPGRLPLPLPLPLLLLPLPLLLLPLPLPLGGRTAVGVGCGGSSREMEASAAAVGRRKERGTRPVPPPEQTKSQPGATATSRKPVTTVPG